MTLLRRILKNYPKRKEELSKSGRVEKGIETFYADQLGMLEDGLTLAHVDGQGGRQFSTPIGRIDFLCKDASNHYVVVEIKAYEARDLYLVKVRQIWAVFFVTLDKAKQQLGE